MTDVNWNLAACRQPGLDPDLWFDPNPQLLDPWAEPRGICHTCPLQIDCLTLALATPEPDGMWGATSPDERRSLHRHLDTLHTPPEPIPLTHQHGTNPRYIAGCRCPDCTTAHARYRADLRRRTRVA